MEIKQAMKALVVLALLAMFALPAIAQESAPTGADELAGDLAEHILAQVAVAIPLVTVLVSVIKGLAPSVPPQWVSLVLSIGAYVAVVHVGAEIPFESVTSLIVAIAGILGINIGAGGVYEISKSLEVPLIKTTRAEYLE